MNTFNIHAFINRYVTGREESFFRNDIVQHHDRLKEAIAGKSVLVIGGGGTIGAAYIRSLLAFRPAKVVVVDNNENGLTELVRDLRSTPGMQVPKEFITYPVNFNSTVFNKLYHYHRPFDIVANFAAHKHVRSEKDIFSVQAMIENNLLNGHALISTLLTQKPAHFFCVSTDKAANPVNIMGATKKLMEDMVLSFAGSMKATTARFANVAFSNGSLPDGFLNRIKYNQPLSVPADVTRYFVSPQESGEICMLASILGDTGDIFFPKFDQTQLTGFLDMAVNLLHELGYHAAMCNSEEEAKEMSLSLAEGSKSYPVYSFVSDTTGEKLYEEFYTGDEDVDMDTYGSLGVIRNNRDKLSIDINECISSIEQLFKKEALQKKEIVQLLARYIPSFAHLEKGATLDSKM